MALILSERRPGRLAKQDFVRPPFDSRKNGPSASWVRIDGLFSLELNLSIKHVHGSSLNPHLNFLPLFEPRSHFSGEVRVSIIFPRSSAIGGTRGKLLLADDPQTETYPHFLLAPVYRWKE